MTSRPGSYQHQGVHAAMQRPGVSLRRCCMYPDRLISIYGAHVRPWDYHAITIALQIRGKNTNFSLKNGGSIYLWSCFRIFRLLEVHHDNTFQNLVFTLTIGLCMHWPCIPTDITHILIATRFLEEGIMFASSYHRYHEVFLVDVIYFLIFPRRCWDNKMKACQTSRKPQGLAWLSE